MNDNQKAIEVGKAIHQLNRIYMKHYENTISLPDAKKLTPIEEGLIGLLEWQDKISIKEVVKLLGVANSTVTSAVNRLEKKGLIMKETLAEDKRIFNLKLTEGGVDIIHLKKYKKNTFYADLLQQLDSDEERTSLVLALEKITRSMEESETVRSGPMNALEREYYDFGPWLIEIKNASDIPSFYLSKKELIMSSKYVFKGPINKEWRFVKPGMLLYKTILCVKEDSIVVLHGSDGHIEEEQILLDDVRYLVHSVDILDSHIIIGLDNKCIDISYNSVSGEISDRVMNHLRKYTFKNANEVNLNEVEGDNQVESNLYRELIHRALHEEQVKVLAFQPTKVLDRSNKGGTDIIQLLAKKMALQESVFVTNGRELIICSRNQPLRPEKEADYSYRHTYIRIMDQLEFTMIDDVEVEGTKDLLIRIHDTHLRFKVGNEFDVESLENACR
jgi:DNA-binding MarR family transcriptional regulator